MADGEVENGRNGVSENQREDLVESISRSLENYGSTFTKNCCIYRVPSKIRRVNEEAYTPQEISIGPFHHGRENLKKMENYKLEYLQKFLERVRDKKCLKDFVTCIQKEEEKIRQCYADPMENFSSDEFVKMILFDAIFILELFLRIHLRYYEHHRFDFVVDRAWPRYQIQEDLILLENQLPFFLLNQLYELAFPSSCPNKFFHLTVNYFSDYNHLNEPTPDTSLKTHYPDDILHFTDFLLSRILGRRYNLTDSCCPCDDCSKYTIGGKMHHYINCQSGDSGSSPESTPLLYSATKLREAGVKFQVGGSSSIFELKFDNGKLEIPNFTFNDNTECVLRNIMALEQCRYPDGTSICNYAQMLDGLINTAQDVELLVDNKIMNNLLGDHQIAATLINNLCLYVGTGGHDRYSRLIQDLNAYYEFPFNSAKANLRHEYFRTPWRSASSLAAIILLALTLTQTIFTIIQTLSKN